MKSIKPNITSISLAQFHEALENLVPEAKEQLRSQKPDYDGLCMAVAWIGFIQMIPNEFSDDFFIIQEAVLDYCDTGLWPGEMTGVTQ